MTLSLNTLSPSLGSSKNRKRFGRGIGCTFGKTCGRGHKGQRSRSGGFHKLGFEGGQMPLQRRVPKFGFRSRKALITGQVTLTEIEKTSSEVVDIVALRAADLITGRIKRVKVIASGKLTRAVKVSGMRVTKGARAAIEKAGGVVLED